MAAGSWHPGLARQVLYLIARQFSCLWGEAGGLEPASHWKGRMWRVASEKIVTDMCPPGGSALLEVQRRSVLGYLFVHL